MTRKCRLTFGKVYSDHTNHGQMALIMGFREVLVHHGAPGRLVELERTFFLRRENISGLVRLEEKIPSPEN